MQSLRDVPAWHEACLRYRYDIYRFAVEGLGLEPTWQQKLLFESIQIPGSRSSVRSGHGTGKTASAGIVALWHLLFFPDSVMMFTAPQINQLRALVWKEITLMHARLYTGPLAWLAEYVVILAEKVYISGHDKTWHVLAKTAPKHSPTNIAGQHGDNYTLWVDEACGVDDAVMDVVMGALTHADNRAVMTSQPARNAGFFYDTHFKLSYAAGGAWTSLCFNGELSPLVSVKTLREMLQKYGSRDDPGYLIRVRGEFADNAGEFLVSRTQSSAVFSGSALEARHTGYGYIISVDVGGGVGRDDTVVSILKVWGEAGWGDRARRVDVVNIPLCTNRDNLHEIAGVINEALLTYSNALIVLDDNGAGRGLGQHLKSLGIYYKPVYWGGACFSNENRLEFVNKRSQAIVSFCRAVKAGRFKILDPYYQIKIEEQLTRIPYGMDENSRWKVLSKDEMKRKGLKSPDIIDTFAFGFLEGVTYTAAENDSDTTRMIQSEQQVWDDLETAWEEPVA